MPLQNDGGRLHRADDGDARHVDRLGGAIDPGNKGLNPERQRVDPRLVFLLRAAAKLDLIEACCQDLDTAFSDLVPAFREIAVAPCKCERKILDSWERYDLDRRKQRLQAWRWRRP